MSALAAARPAPKSADARLAVRYARADDAPALEGIERVSFDHDRLSSRALAHHLRSPRADAFVVTLGGDIVGYCLLLYRSGSTLSRLYSIATAPGARGLGVGRRLMETCERAARKRGCNRLRLEVRENNLPAIALYEKLGYRRIGRYENYYQDGASAIRFEKRLVSP